jgi:hypothetical protein
MMSRTWAALLICAWILWAASTDTVVIFPLEGFTSKAECEMEGRRRIPALKDQRGIMTMLCLPDTIDPRAAKR